MTTIASKRITNAMRVAPSNHCVIPTNWAIAPSYTPQLLERIQRATAVETGAGPTAGPVDDVRRLGVDIQRVDAVAVINIVDFITKNPTLFFGTSTREVEAAITAALADDSIRQILLWIDSPGGSVDGLADLSDLVFTARRVKPITAFVDGLAASAAYLIASQASEIVAGKGSLAGSVGTLQLLLDTSEAFQTAGIRPVLITTGKFKGIGIPGIAITPEQEAYLQKIVDQFFADFRRAVARGRGMSIVEVDKVADGKVFREQEALSLRLIDRIQNGDALLAGLVEQERALAQSRTKRAQQKMRLVEAELWAMGVPLQPRPQPKVNLSWDSDD